MAARMARRATKLRRNYCFGVRAGGRFGGRSFEIISRREVCYLVEITEPEFLIRRGPSRTFEMSKAESHHSI